MSRALLKWIADMGLESALIGEAAKAGMVGPVPARPNAKPWQNGVAESFNGKFRDECLSLEWFRSREKARVLIEHWRRHYNEDRPHSALGNLTPAAYAAKLAAGTIEPRKRRRPRPAPGRSAAICEVSAARPVAPSETVVQAA